LEVAQRVVTKHADGLCEDGWYDYAIIEGFSQGWYPKAHFEEWYQFVREGTEYKAVKIEKPEQFKRVCNFGIG
jgi:hypothetical protein